MTDQMLIADAHEEIAELKQQLEGWQDQLDEQDTVNLNLLKANKQLRQQLNETIQISPELRDRIIECLQINKDNPLAELAQYQDLLHYPSYKRKADMLEKEIAEIDSILKELAVK